MTKTLVDPSVFEELSEAMGAEFAADLVLTFLTDAENMFADLTQAVADGNLERYRRASHSIKSNALTFGAMELADTAREMELSGVIDAGASETLKSTFDTTATALRGLLDG